MGNVVVSVFICVQVDIMVQVIEKFEISSPMQLGSQSSQSSGMVKLPSTGEMDFCKVAAMTVEV